jgi:hypothetical protein
LGAEDSHLRKEKMRAIDVVGAFYREKQGGPSHGLETNGIQLSLYRNVIAEWREEENQRKSLWIRVNGITGATCDCRGWHLSPEKLQAMRQGDFAHNYTTRKKINLIPGVNVSILKGVLYLNGEIWDGLWKKIQRP